MAKTRIQFNYKKIDDAIFSPLQETLVKIGFAMERDIKMSMERGSGVIYVKKGGVIHQASVPGQPPAVDTGRLRASISTNWSNSGEARGAIGGQAVPEDGICNPGGDALSSQFGGGKFRVVVGTNVEYAPWLEFGTSRMAARPFLRPVFEKYKPAITRLLRGKE